MLVVASLSTADLMPRLERFCMKLKIQPFNFPRQTDFPRGPAEPVVEMAGFWQARIPADRLAIEPKLACYPPLRPTLVV
jgi:hypothetical protein